MKQEQMSRKLKIAYNSMIKFEKESKMTREQRKTLIKEAEKEKHKDWALNYQKASVIRHQETNWRQAQEFINKL